MKPETQQALIDGDFTPEVAQDLIDTGAAWQLEGSIGRSCMDMIEAGFCTVGKEAHRDYWGNVVPSIEMLEPGSKGTPEYVEKMSAEREVAL